MLDFYKWMFDIFGFLDVWAGVVLFGQLWWRFFLQGDDDDDDKHNDDQTHYDV